MTDAEIEQIARLYCRKLGLDPDEQIAGSAMWTYHIATVHGYLRSSALAMQEAIAEVRATVTEGGEA